ncbi:MAG TPA: outer membrane protein assembly factor BamE [Steroidobacteraceae bacterium]
MQRDFIHFRRLLVLACALLGAALLGGCVYRIDIQQGNFLKPEEIERVKVGMTRVQVRALLGTPMIADPFQSDRWDYVYYVKRGKFQRVFQRHFTVYFDEQDKVVRIEREQDTMKRVADNGELIDETQNTE